MTCGISSGVFRNLRAVLQSTCADLQSHQPSVRVPFSLHALLRLLLIVLLITALLGEVRWYLLVVVSCNFPKSWHTGASFHISHGRL